MVEAETHLFFQWSQYQTVGKPCCRFTKLESLCYLQGILDAGQDWQERWYNLPRIAETGF